MRARHLLGTATIAVAALLASLVTAWPASAWSNSALLGPVLGELPARAAGGGSGTAALNDALDAACGGPTGVGFVRWFSLPGGDLGLIKAQGQGSIGWLGRMPIETTVHQALVDSTTGSVISCTGIGRVGADVSGVVAVWFDTVEYDRVRGCANPMIGCQEPWIDVHVGPTTGVVPHNDHVSSATAIGTLPYDDAGDRTLADDDGPLLTSEHPVDHQVASVWYRITAPATGMLPISAPGSYVGVGHETSSGVEPVDGFGAWEVKTGETYLIKITTNVGDYEHYDPLPRGRLYHVFVGEVGAPPAAGVTAASGSAGSVVLSWTGSAVSDPTQSLEFTFSGPGAPPSFAAPLGAGFQQRVVTGLTAGAAYTVTTRARNAVGLGVPGEAAAHAGVSALDGGSVFQADVAVDAAAATATLTWVAAYDDPQPVTGYRVARDGRDSFGVGPWSTLVSKSTTSFTFSHLVRGQTYRLSVTPVTADGDRPTWSLAAPVLARPVVPGSDLGLTYTWKAGADPVSGYVLTWGPPSSDGQSPITGYRVTRDGVDADGAGPLTVDLPATATSFDLPHLLGNVDYRVVVRALNAVGAGAEESLSTMQLQPDPPSAPTEVVAVPADASALVSWKAPVTWGSLPASSYRVYAYTDGSTQVASTGYAAKDATSLVMPGLQNERSYTFTVQAWSTDSVSPESLPSAAVVIGAPPRPAASVPGAPVVGKATGVAVAGKVRATVRWSPPTSDGGSSVRSYVVSAYVLTAKGQLLRRIGVTKPISAAARSWTLTLPAGRYRFTVRAGNAIGYSLPSGWTNVVAPMTVPGAPIVGTAVSGVKGGAITATATWKPPVSTGGTPVTAYVVYAYRVSSSGRVLSTTVSTKLPARYRSYVFPYLTYGWYRFAVRAVNAMGYGAYSSKSLRVIGR